MLLTEWNMEDCIAYRNEEIREEYRSIIADKDAKIADQKAEIANKDAEIAAVIADKDAEIARLQAALNAR